ncbi:hypothetical protein [Bradyrhizobium sp. CCBAU 11434]|uniref:hypothetical protein n=1 Tax=Bradyrhizobium sp. CCBAU 11434 TaxID=1630885 RepID=UPI002306CEA5|nr:hypothetical protein [Bradyrhizobium sp. CCBAU 11434]
MISLLRIFSATHPARSRRFRSASILCGVVLSASLGGAAQADTSSVADTVMSDVATQIGTLMTSMSLGCGGGNAGVPPVSWPTLQQHGYNAGTALTNARISLAKGQPTVAMQQITSAETELTALVNGAHNSCSGGGSGEDPPGMNRYLTILAVSDAKLDVVKLFLAP